MTTSTDRITTRISKLLAQAEGTDKPEEAETFLAAAQMLAASYSIDLAVARSVATKATEREVPEKRTVSIGRRGQRSLRHYLDLLNAIAHVNDVKMTFLFNHTEASLFGFPSDLDVVEALYVSLLGQMVRAGNEYLASGAHREPVYDAPTRRWTEPVHGSTARSSFYEGWIVQVSTRLSEARQEAEAQAHERHDVDSDNSSGAAVSVTTLALRDKTEQVESFFDDHYRGKRLHTARQRYTGTDYRSMDAGRESGKKASLSDRRSKALGA